MSYNTNEISSNEILHRLEIEQLTVFFQGHVKKSRGDHLEIVVIRLQTIL